MGSLRMDPILQPLCRHLLPSLSELRQKITQAGWGTGQVEEVVIFFNLILEWRQSNGREMQNIIGMLRQHNPRGKYTYLLDILEDLNAKIQNCTPRIDIVDNSSQSLVETNELVGTQGEIICNTIDSLETALFKPLTA